MTYNYHTHTARCGHATGKPEAYIKRAIENGVTHMGFSDHAPYRYPNGFQSGFRVPMEEAADYFAELSALREKYKEQVDLKIGFEMEYFPTYFADMLKTVTDLGAEYLILGQHYSGDELPNGVHTTIPTESVEELRSYVGCVVTAIKSGVFTYVAHPDVINFVGDTAVYEEEMRKICITAREADIPLEINCLGIRDHRNYPNERFWKIAGEEQAPVTIGFDAHDVKSAFDAASVKKAKALIEKYNLHYIGMPKLRPIR